MTASAMKELNAFARSLEGTKPVAHVADHALIIEIVGNQQIEEGHALECRLGRPAVAVAVRVVGVPSSGDKPNQAFSSCSELEAFSD